MTQGQPDGQPQLHRLFTEEEGGDNNKFKLSSSIRRLDSLQVNDRPEPRSAGKSIRKATVVSTTNINTEQYQSAR